MIPDRSLCENWGGVDTSRGYVPGHSLSAPLGRRARHPTAQPWCAGQTWARADPGRDLAFSLLSAGDAIHTKKPSPSPGSFGHQYKKFSFEGTAGLVVTLLVHSSWGAQSPWQHLLATAESPRVSDKEQPAGATDLVPHEPREGLIMCVHSDIWGTYLQEL